MLCFCGSTTQTFMFLSQQAERVQFFMFMANTINSYTIELWVQYNSELFRISISEVVCTILESYYVREKSIRE
ncbi:hypothetical protein Mapa_006924 [Marchantia paleacea]|nr:hypothetical protein Mapa_006924 [Marchantia paleacea]